MLRQKNVIPFYHFFKRVLKTLFVITFILFYYIRFILSFIGVKIRYEKSSALNFSNRRKVFYKRHIHRFCHLVNKYFNSKSMILTKIYKHEKRYNQFVYSLTFLY